MDREQARVGIVVGAAVLELPRAQVAYRLEGQELVLQVVVDRDVVLAHHALHRGELVQRLVRPARLEQLVGDLHHQLRPRRGIGGLRQRGAQQRDPLRIAKRVAHGIGLPIDPLQELGHAARAVRPARGGGAGDSFHPCQQAGGPCCSQGKRERSPEGRPQERAPIGARRRKATREGVSGDLLLWDHRHPRMTLPAPGAPEITLGWRALIWW
jgi:hypothetical protein